MSKHEAEMWKLWEEFGNVPIDENECIDIDWSPSKNVVFKKGTDRFEIWYWFEDIFDVKISDLIHPGQ